MWWILWCRSQAAAFLLEINGSPDSPNIPTELLFQVPNIGGLTVGLIYCHTRTSGGGNAGQLRRLLQQNLPLYGPTPREIYPKKETCTGVELIWGNNGFEIKSSHPKSADVDKCAPACFS